MAYYNASNMKPRHMAFPLALTSAPELRAYPNSVRQLLVQRAISRLNAESKLATWLQILLIVGGGVLGTIVAIWVMGGLVSGTPKPRQIVIGINGNFLGGGIGCVVGAVIWLALRAHKIRPYLRTVIEEYEHKTSL